MDELVVGIDLGTTNSCIAVKRNGKIDVIPNHEGKRTTLSFVYYGNKNVSVGKTAKHEAAVKPCNGIYEIKRIIGCLHDDPHVEAEKKWLTYNFVRGMNGEVKIELDNCGEKSYKFPEEICARILYKLKNDAEKYLNRPVTKAVITVPAYFNNNQRAATRDAAKIAGFDVLKLLNEPSAAALAYVTENISNKPRNILIYDLGGGTFDVSLVSSDENNNIKVLSVDGDTHLGGQDFLNRLVTYVAEEIEMKYKISVTQNKRFMRNIINLCEKTKKILTTSYTTSITVEFLTTESVDLIITREKFEEINKDLFDRTIKIVDKCIRNRRLTKDDIDEVLLVGGASRVPKIQSLLENYFNNKTIRKYINADEAIAMGAAIEADFISKNSSEASLIVDVLPLSIGSVLDNNKIFFNLARNTPLPANSQHVRTVLNKKQKSGCILSIYEGEDLNCNNNVLLGANEIKWVNSKMANRSVQMTMQIDTSGIIRVRVAGDTIKAFNIVLNKGRLEEEEILKLKQEIEENL